MGAKVGPVYINAMPNVQRKAYLDIYEGDVKIGEVEIFYAPRLKEPYQVSVTPKQPGRKLGDPSRATDFANTLPEARELALKMAKAFVRGEERS